VCEVVLHLHPLGILFKPLASFFATFLIVPLAQLFGYWEKPIPAYVMLAGCIGTYLCLYERRRGEDTERHVELAALDDLEEGEERPVDRSRSLPAGVVLGTETMEDNFSVSEHYHENAGKTVRDKNSGKVRDPEAVYQAVDSDEVEKHVVEKYSEATGLLGGGKGGEPVGRGSSPVGFLLLGGIFAVLVTAMSVWVIVQKLVNDRCRVNEFGFTALDQVGAPRQEGAEGCVSAWQRCCKVFVK
jgi:hypothetical protein